MRFRFGISDDRIYEALAAETPAAGAWHEMRIDLSRYAGRKFSIFYQPDGRTWRLVFATDQLAGEACTAFWGEPAVYADVEAARQFRLRGNPGAP